MQKLVQIIYISRSTFDNTDEINKIEPNVIRILAKSRVNNRKNGLVGVLYFGVVLSFNAWKAPKKQLIRYLLSLRRILAIKISN